MAGGTSRHKIRARLKEGTAEVRMLLQHPMETGNRKDPDTGLKVPRHFIRELRCDYNGEQVLLAHWSWGMARNPYLAFGVRDGQVGDRVRVSWSDDRGQQTTIETVVS